MYTINGEVQEGMGAVSDDESVRVSLAFHSSECARERER